ncbi:flavohemoglobin expression-modulating QEGLA motif protein [Paracrocinitomix mangrovi]|uniref:flavohemoglobin expression-modulating QEGLA motif protein n=1 Tax=Paracrocinitomix mangrovi TaxID=2862509 RepID=UPI001EDA1DA7|nr:flavohemoglobin expression-modulating QEGLA motif protein [Paracrocinitomix mangrovi]UKN03703.1 flavohemoglobin expression-modulating QEGLA motif protein [Paracrocinitomix mangrovi]
MNTDKSHIIQLSDMLEKAASSVRILRNIDWPKEVKTEFFRNNAEKLPVVEYEAYDPKDVLHQIRQIRKLANDESDEVHQWVNKIADKIESSSMMLASRGTHDFFKYSKELYGEPTAPLPGEEKSALSLAKHFDHIFDHITEMHLGAPLNDVNAEHLAAEMEKAVNKMFGEHAPEVVLDNKMASKAIAGRRRIKVRPSATFTEKDINQLIEHEAAIHVGTSINGYLQPHLKILSESHAGTTKTQEGIAVFAEYITGYIDLDRVMRLTDRVLANQMAVEGADFIEVYRFYQGRSASDDAAYDNARRVFRGGVITGGAPFTKDIVYLDGFIRVHQYLKECMLNGNIDDLNLLFCGKLDISDIPILKHFHSLGLVEMPRYLPTWMNDKRFLLTHLAYGSFLSD